MRQKGRKAPQRTPQQTATMAMAYALLEDMARAGFAEQGRGFLFYGFYPDGTVPYVQYLTLDTQPGAGFVPSAPDLVKLVRTYDPQTSFVIFHATINLDNAQLEEVRIEISPFLTGQTTPSA